MPGVVDEAVAIDSVELAPEVTEVGDRVAVTPAGAPETVRATVCAEPEVVAVEMVALADPPAATVAEVGDAAIEKSLVTVPLVTIAWAI